VLREWHGTQSGAGKPQRIAITTVEQWRNAWTTAHSGEIPQPELPVVDFGRHMVLAAFMGQKPTGGFEVRITRVTRAADGSVVAHVRETSPPPGAMVTKVITSPYHFVVVARTAGEVTFVDASGT
jgi:hypothetical protein